MKDDKENKFKILVLMLGTIVIIISLIILFFSKKEETNTPNNISEDKSYKYSLKSNKFIYTNPETNESKEFNLFNFRLDFYDNKLNICYLKNSICESHQYTMEENRVLNIKGKSEISPFTGIYFITFKDDYVLMEKNNGNNENVIYKFNLLKLGGEK